MRQMRHKTSALSLLLNIESVEGAAPVPRAGALTGLGHAPPQIEDRKDSEVFSSHNPPCPFLLRFSGGAAFRHAHKV